VLERLLDLGVQVLDGNAQALLKIPPTLAIAIHALDNVHAVVGALPAGGGRHLHRVLARHVERRKRLDLEELDKLAAAVQAADHPQLVGRSVVIAALVLLSNLASDERWLGVVNATHHAA
jgi:hypothetical protein